jgi:RNA polymerase sigma-70 factor (ECF subfamily)
MSVCRSIDLLRSNRPSELTEAKTFELDAGISSCPVEIAIANELHDQIRNAIADLPTREAQAFCLMFFENQSNQQISDSLNISRGAVATAISKARSKLELVFRRTSSGKSK